MVTTNHLFIVECDSEDNIAAVHGDIIDRTNARVVGGYFGPSTRRQMYEVIGNKERRAVVEKQLRRLSRGKIKFRAVW